MCHSKVVAWFRPEQLEGWSFHSPKRQRLQEGMGFGKMIKNLVTDVLSLRCPLDICQGLNSIPSKFMC